MEKAIKKVIIVLLLTFVTTALMTSLYIFLYKARHTGIIRVGILHSQNGTMAISEKPVIDATLLAIDEINNNGGLFGQLIEPIIVDGRSDTATFAALAETLIAQNKVTVIFGCWTSDSRKAVKDVVEKHDSLLFYPVQYEGLETSPNIVYTGACSNQQLLPAAAWSFYNLGKTLYLVGSDYVFPRAAHTLIKNYVSLFGAKIVGEAYQPVVSVTFDSIVQDIAAAQPAVIINTLNGSSNIAFFKALKKSEKTSKIPTMSLSIAEVELQALDAADLTNDYVACNYFQSIENKKNVHFIEQFKKKYGAHRVVSDAMEAAYFGVYLWAHAVTHAKTTRPSIIKQIIKGQGMQAPEGIVYIDYDNNHTWKTVRIGKIEKNKQISRIWSSEKAICPIPYPLFSDYNWEGLLTRLYKNWNNKWSA